MNKSTCKPFVSVSERAIEHELKHVQSLKEFKSKKETELMTEFQKAKNKEMLIFQSTRNFNKQLLGTRSTKAITQQLSKTKQPMS